MVLRLVLLQTVIQYQFFPGINLKYGTSERLSGSHNSNTELLLKKIHKELIFVDISTLKFFNTVKFTYNLRALITAETQKVTHFVN